MVLNLLKRSLLKWILGILLLSHFETTFASPAETMFEGYYTIKSGGVPAGFVIQRYSFDKAKKQFSIVYYIRTNKLAGDITESLRAVSNDKFEPINYQYTSRIGEQIQTIDATFKNDTASFVVSDGKMQNKAEKKLPKGTFLASFLNYMILSRGISAGKAYDYQGLAEEKAEVLPGKVLVQEELSHSGIPAFKIFNEYGGSRFISIMSKTGEVLQTKSPVQSIETELVASASQATQGFMLDTKALSILFGSVPIGKVNLLHKGSSSLAPAPKTPSNSSTANQNSQEDQKKNSKGSEE
jgi:hypothetical protein